MFNLLGPIGTKFLELFYPGSSLNWSDWVSFCNTLVFFSIIAAVIGLLVFLAMGLTRTVTSAADVFQNHRPYRDGRITTWVIVFTAAIIIAFTGFLASWRSFLNINVLLFIALCACFGWLLYSILSYLVCRIPFMARYRYLPFWSRKFGGKKA